MTEEIDIKMADKTDKIFNALRLVPEFDGNPNVLVRFLDICDKLVITYINSEPGNELNNSALLNGILNKITGSAARTLFTNGIPRNWDGIRNTLVNTFSDHRDESALYTDLSLIIQGQDTPQIFYEKVQNLLSIIVTYIELHETISTTIEAKRSLYKKLALQTFTRGLNEPLGSRIRCMKPESLEQALEFAQEELNVLYLQNRHQPNFYRKPTPQSTQFNQPTQRPFNHPNPPPYMNTQRPQYQGQGPSRTQQVMRALPRSNMSTGFKIPPRYQPSHQIQPQPMSGISHPVARTLPPTYRTNPRQIHMNETHDPQIYQTYDDYDYTVNPEYNQLSDFSQENQERNNFSDRPKS